MQKITPYLWFDGNAEEAVNFYVSIFKDAKIELITRYPKEVAAATKMPEDAVLTIAFELKGQKFVALNGGPAFKFTEAISLLINCETQDEIDEFWEKLSEGGEKSRCGWLKDKYGLSWQVAPANLGELMSNPVKVGKVMHEVMQMDKLDIARIRQAAEQD